MELAVGRARHVFGFFLPFRRLVFSFVSFHPQPSEVLSVQQFMSRDSGGKVTSKPAGRLWFLSIPGRFRLKQEPFMFSTEVSQKFFFSQWMLG